MEAASVSLSSLRVSCKRALIVVYQNNLQWGGLVTSSYSPLLMIKVEKNINGNIEN